jgi:hypothetical protein
MQSFQIIYNNRSDHPVSVHINSKSLDFITLIPNEKQESNYKSFKSRKGTFCIIIGDVTPDYFSNFQKWCEQSNEEVLPPVFDECGKFFYALEIDLKEETVHVYTGLFGILPIYYYQRGQSIIISSDIPGIAGQVDVSLSTDPQFILEQSIFNYSFSNRTIYNEIKLTPANSLLTLKNGSLKVREYYSVNKLFQTSYKQWKKSIVPFQELFTDRVKNYFPDQKYYVSFTSGFDGRTLVACSHYHKKQFGTYSYGSADNEDVVIPMADANVLGIEHIPVYLDEVYAMHGFREYGKRIIMESAANTNFLFAHHPYSAEKISQKTGYLINGHFGSEIFRASHIGGQVTSNELVTIFSNKDKDRVIHDLKNSPRLKLLKLNILDHYIDNLFEEIFSFMEKISALSQNHKFYYYIYTEVFRKIFGAHLICQMPYATIRSPFLDLVFIEEIMKTGLAGANNAFFTHNPLKRFKGQLVYGRIIKNTYPELAKRVTGKGYSPQSILSYYGLLKIVPVFVQNRIKQRYQPSDINNLAIPLGFNSNMDFFTTIRINDLYDEKAVDLLRNSDQWTKMRDLLLITLSTNFYLEQLTTR